MFDSLLMRRTGKNTLRPLSMPLRDKTQQVGVDRQLQGNPVQDGQRNAERSSARRWDTSNEESVMGLLAFVCALILVIIIPNEIWAALFYLGLVIVLAWVGFWALVLWLAGI